MDFSLHKASTKLGRESAVGALVLAPLDVGMPSMTAVPGRNLLVPLVPFGTGGSGKGARCTWGTGWGARPRPPHTKHSTPWAPVRTADLSPAKHALSP